MQPDNHRLSIQRFVRVLRNFLIDGIRHGATLGDALCITANRRPQGIFSALPPDDICGFPSRRTRPQPMQKRGESRHFPAYFGVLAQIIGVCESSSNPILDRDNRNSKAPPCPWGQRVFATGKSRWQTTDPETRRKRCNSRNSHEPCER